VPRLACWFVRASLVHLVAAFTAGALLLAEKGLARQVAVWRLFPAHLELALVGWSVQLAMGVAFWMLPRFAGGVSRGDERPAWAAFWLLNGGVALAGLAPVFGTEPGLALAGRTAEAAAVVAFVIHAWSRVRGPTVGPSGSAGPAGRRA
jgi:hypothetical protein